MIYVVSYNHVGLSKQDDYKKQKILTKALLNYVLNLKLSSSANSPNMDFDFEKHGKPRLKNSMIEFNTSNCRGLVCCIISKKEVGIDVETIRENIDRRTEKVCTKSEINEINLADNKDLMFTKFWTLKEGYLKYTGRGLGFGAKNVEFTYKENMPTIRNIVKKGVNFEPSKVYIEQSEIEINDMSYVISQFSNEKIPFEIKSISEERLFSQEKVDE